MSGMEHVPMGPPWSVDLIADLHAGVLPPEVAAQLRPRVEADRKSAERACGRLRPSTTIRSDSARDAGDGSARP